MTHERIRHPLDFSPPRLADLAPRTAERDAAHRASHEAHKAAWMEGRMSKRRPILSLFDRGAR